MLGLGRRFLRLLGMVDVIPCHDELAAAFLPLDMPPQAADVVVDRPIIPQSASCTVQYEVLF